MDLPRQRSGIRLFFGPFRQSVDFMVHGPFFDLLEKSKIRFWIGKSGFGLGNPDLDFPPKNAPIVFTAEVYPRYN